MKYLNETEILLYYSDNNLDPSACYCKDCGKFLSYDSKFHINSHTHKLVTEGLSFLSSRYYNGHKYYLCRCYDCVCKLYPEFKKVKFKFAHKAAKYTQYGFNVSDEDFKPVCKARLSVTKEKMIKKYGKEDGLKHWDSYCKKLSDTNKFEYKHEKYGMTEEEYDEYNRSRAVTLDNMVKRHGEKLGKKYWDLYCEKLRYTCTKEYFIKLYGEKIGILKYENFVDKRNSTVKIFGPSNISLELFNELIKSYKDNTIFYNDNEYKIKTDNNLYFVDYYDLTLNIVIEFYGDYYHFNPNKFSEDTIAFKNSDHTVCAKDKWEHDKIRIEDILKTLDCKVIIVWESTFKSHKKETVKTLILMINNKELLDNITEI